MQGCRPTSEKSRCKPAVRRQPVPEFEQPTSTACASSAAVGRVESTVDSRLSFTWVDYIVDSTEILYVLALICTNLYIS